MSGRSRRQRQVVPVGPPIQQVATWRTGYLVSNRPNVAEYIDLSVVAPWGIVIRDEQLWVANNGTDSISNFDLFGRRMLSQIGVRNRIHNSAFPTGIVANCQGGFSVTGLLGGTRSATLLTCSELGSVHGYNPETTNLLARIVLNQNKTGLVHVYKGLALHGGLLYLADFFRGNIDVFDRDYVGQEGFLFQDTDMSNPIPTDYGPSNIVAIGQYLYVLYSRRDPEAPVSAFEGVGYGYISRFNPDGSFAGRFASNGVLNDPWAMIPAPPECGYPPGSFLVGNHGDGRINVFAENGAYIRPMAAQNGQPIVIEGLRGLAGHYCNYSRVFFTAGNNTSTDGVIGVLTKDQLMPVIL